MGSQPGVVGFRRYLRSPKSQLLPQAPLHVRQLVRGVPHHALLLRMRSAPAESLATAGTGLQPHRCQRVSRGRFDKNGHWQNRAACHSIAACLALCAGFCTAVFISKMRLCLKGLEDTGDVRCLFRRLQKCNSNRITAQHDP